MNQQRQSVDLLSLLPQEKKPRLTLLVCLGLWLLVLLIMGIVAIVGGSLLAVTHSNINSKIEQIKNAKRLAEEKRYEVDSRKGVPVAFIKRKRADRTLYYQYLLALTSFSLKQAWLLNIKFQGDKDVRFIGMSYNSNSIYDFLEQLNKTKAYAGVNFKGVRAVKDKDVLNKRIRNSLPGKFDVNRYRVEVNRPYEWEIINAYRFSKSLPLLGFKNKKTFDARVADFEKYREHKAQPKKNVAWGYGPGGRYEASTIAAKKKEKIVIELPALGFVISTNYQKGSPILTKKGRKK